MDNGRTRSKNSNRFKWNMKTILFVLAMTNLSWRPVYSQLPLSSSSDNGQPKRNVGKASGDLLAFQNRGHVAMAAASGRTLGRSQSSISSLCEESLDCSEERRKPICGTDGRTYSSRCEITKAKCRGHLVDFKHKGKCPESGRCLAQRSQAIEQSRRNPHEGVFIPECKEDGNYKEVQCYEITGYCWCADEKGRPHGRSSVRYKKPNCDQQGSRRLNRRRTSSKVPKQNKACGNSDRSTFNHNLIEHFRSEYTRNIPSTTAVPSPGLESDPLLDTEQKRVVQWKFTQLDLNSDNILNKKEVRDLRRMVKKIVTPRSCAKSFTKYCDMDQDKRITRGEWSTCLGVDINSGGFQHGGSEISDESDDDEDADDVVLPMNVDDATSASHDSLGVPSAEQVDTASTADHPFHPSQRKDSSFGVSTDSLVRKNPLPINEGGDDPSWARPSMIDARVSDAGIDSKEEDLTDCFSARRLATEQHQQDPGGGHFIPNCTPEGGFQSAQCHTGYCFCVHEKSGKTIRGTATKGYKPDCEAAKRSAKTFKGCSLKKKQKFTEEYLEFLAKEMAEFYKNKSQSVLTDQVTKDQLARWKLTGLDSNKNQILDRKEWKAFRKDWKAFRKGNPRRTKLRKCWRNYLRYCDSNEDHRITMPEWLSCTNSNDVVTHTAALEGASSIIRTNVPEKGNRQRIGPNPFHKILKSD